VRPLGPSGLDGKVQVPSLRHWSWRAR
jgi:hypothetical protein